MTNIAGLSPQQCQAARMLLGWTRETLSEKSKITGNTIFNFEKGKVYPRVRTIQCLTDALKSAGVRFTNEGGKEGVSLVRKASGGEV